MNSILNNEEKFTLNFDISYEKQLEAAKRLKKNKVQVEEVQITLWKVKGEYLTPSAFINRVTEGYYDETKKTDGGRETEVDVPSDNGRFDGATRKRGAAKLLRGNPDKRKRQQQRGSGDGEGAGETIRRKASKIPQGIREEVKDIRKRRTRVSEISRDYYAGETGLARRREPDSDRAESVRARRSVEPLNEALRQRGKARNAPETRVRKRQPRLARR